MSISYGIGVTDKVLLILTMLAALFLYTKRISWNRKGVVPFVLCVCGAFLLGYGVEWLTRRYELPINSLYITNLCDILLVLICVFAVDCLKKIERGTVLFAACAAYATICLANAGFTLVNFFLFGPKGLLDLRGMEAEMLIRSLVFLMIYAAVFITCDRIFIAKWEQTEYAVDHSVYFIFLIIFISNVFLGSMEDDLVYFIIHLNKMLFAVLVLFLLFRQSRILRLREENARLTYIMETQREQYEEAKHSVEEINLKAHDIKHFVDLFGDHNAIPAPVLDTLNQAYENYESTYDTGSKALDITLTEKCRSFRAESITFSVIADGAALSFMSDVDIYVLFGNLIENAKEAVLEIQDHEQRIVALYVKRMREMLSLHMENTAAQMPDFENGMPRTTKKDTVNHGFGTKSIRSVVEKYGGSVNMSCDGRLFSVDIAIPMREP